MINISPTGRNTLQQGYLDNWLICGPFYSDRGWALLDEDYLFGETRVVPRQGMHSFGREWVPWDIRDNCVQFLFAPFEHTLFCTAYAHTYVYAPEQIDALFLCGSDDGIAVWVNGEQAWYNDVNRACVSGDDRARITLNRGWNSVLVKVRQGMAHWQFTAQILGRDEKEIPGLLCSREAEYMAVQDDSEALGVRIRFATEAYEIDDKACCRSVQFEIGNISKDVFQDVCLLVAGEHRADAETLEPGATRTIYLTLPFDVIVSLMSGKAELTATVSGRPVRTLVQLSRSSRLLRDFFAPFYVQHGSDVGVPGIMQIFPNRELAQDDKGRYILADPPGLRLYLGGLIGRFPMREPDNNATGRVCDQLLAHAMAGEVGEFTALLSQAELLPLGDQ